MALEKTIGSEIFVPKIPSMKITELAKAIAPECRHEITGIRPGEKIHEVMIGIDDARDTAEFENYYAILPQHGVYPELLKKQELKMCPDGFEYNSKTNPWFLTIEELREMIIDAPVL